MYKKRPRNTHITVNLTSEIRLEQSLKEADIENPAMVVKLTITGIVLFEDFKYIRKNMGKTLQELDMQQASIWKNIIPYMAFYDCTALTSLLLPDTIVDIHYCAFDHNPTGLTSFHIPKSCSNIPSYVIGSSTISIIVNADHSVFASVDGILFNKEKTKLLCYPAGRRGSYHISNSVLEVRDWSFQGCTGLTSITVDSNHAAFSSEDGVLFNKDKTTLICYPAGRKEKNYKIPDTVEEIRSDVFLGCSNLTSIHIPNTISEFDPSCFSDCINLLSITVNSDHPTFASVEGVLFNKQVSKLRLFPAGRKGFYKIPNSVLEFGNQDCYIDIKSKLTSISIPDTIPEVPIFRRCNTLISIEVHRDIPFESSSLHDFMTILECEHKSYWASIDGVLFNKDKTELIYYPVGRKGDYSIPNTVVRIKEAAFGSCTGLTAIQIPNSITTIDKFAFHYCTELTTLHLPASVKEIETSCFDSCKRLTSITVDSENPVYVSENGVLFNKDKTELLRYPTGRQGGYSIPNTVVRIKEAAFDNCTGLTAIQIPNSVVEIEGGAFSGCNSLVSVVIPDSVNKISDFTFDGCDNLKQITIPDTVTAIEGYSFYHCISLESIMIPHSVTRIEEGAFSTCIELTSISIPDSVKEIEEWAFNECSGLVSVHIPASVVEIADNAFYGCHTFITVSPDNPFYTSENGILKEKNSSQ